MAPGGSPDVPRGLMKAGRRWRGEKWLGGNIRDEKRQSDVDDHLLGFNIPRRGEGWLRDVLEMLLVHGISE
uniref:Uncharacterized protein n=1 Tax=Oryza punctata TaxID=4537 RepID=A0A0E0M6E6_ORYPU